MIIKDYFKWGDLMNWQWIIIAIVVAIVFYLNDKKKKKKDALKKIIALDIIARSLEEENLLKAILENLPENEAAVEKFAYFMSMDITKGRIHFAETQSLKKLFSKEECYCIWDNIEIMKFHLVDSLFSDAYGHDLGILFICNIYDNLKEMGRPYVSTIFKSAESYNRLTGTYIQDPLSCTVQLLELANLPLEKMQLRYGFEQELKSLATDIFDILMTFHSSVSKLFPSIKK